MKCPFCGKMLVPGERKEFETILDHVFNPNAESYPLRPTWICDCEYSIDSFWDEDGHRYGGRNSFDYAKLHELFPTSNYHAASDSFASRSR